MTHHIHRPAQHCVCGVLVRDAIATECIGNAFGLDIELRSPGEPEPIVGRQQYGHGNTAEAAARSAAARLRQGTHVAVRYCGLGIGYTHDDQAAIALVGIDSIELRTFESSSSTLHTHRKEAAP